MFPKDRGYTIWRNSVVMRKSIGYCEKVSIIFYKVAQKNGTLVLMKN